MNAPDLSLRGPKRSTTLAVAAVVREPVAVIRRFVEWYRDLGAQRVTLYFDDPTDPAIAVCAQDYPLVQCIPCTPEFWAAVGVDPQERFTLRQNAALTHAYQTLEEEWLLVVDADELLYLASGNFLRRLSRTPPDVSCLRILPAEHVACPDRDRVDSFRLPISRKRVNRVYGPLSDIFRRRFGLVGHADGKSIYRRGVAGISLRQHWANDAAGKQVPAMILTASSGLYLLHYFASDYDVWRSKVEWRISASGFSGLARDFLNRRLGEEADQETAYRQLYDMMHAVDGDRKAHLKHIGGLLELPSQQGGLGE